MKKIGYYKHYFAFIFLAVLFTHGCSKESAALDVRLDNEHWQICVLKGGEKKARCFNFPEFTGYDRTTVGLENEEIVIHNFSGTHVATIDIKCRFDTVANKLIMKNIVLRSPDRHAYYDGVSICRIDAINKNIGDMDGDSLFDNLTSRPNGRCRYEYEKLPPLQKILDDMIEMAKEDDEGWMLRNYSEGENIDRYKGYLRAYPISGANHVIYNNMGYYLERVEAYDAAIYILSAVIERYPLRVVAYLNIADAYWGNNDVKNAVKNYKEYIRLMKSQKKDTSKIPQHVYDRIK